MAREKPRHKISAAFDKAALESNTTTKYYRGMWETYGRKEGSSAGALVDPETQGLGGRLTGKNKHLARTL